MIIPTPLSKKKHCAEKCTLYFEYEGENKKTDSYLLDVHFKLRER